MERIGKICILIQPILFRQEVRFYYNGHPVGASELLAEVVGHNAAGPPLRVDVNQVSVLVSVTMEALTTISSAEYLLGHVRSCYGMNKLV